VADEISDLRLFAAMGVRLLKRGPRPLTLTGEGSLRHERAVTILRDIDAAGLHLW
jgi:DNA-binding transcriptional LysR family regulator